MTPLDFTKVFAVDAVNPIDSESVNYYALVAPELAVCIAAKLENGMYVSKDCYCYPFVIPNPYWAEDTIIRNLTLEEVRELNALSYTPQVDIWLALH